MTRDKREIVTMESPVSNTAIGHLSRLVEHSYDDIHQLEVEFVLTDENGDETTLYNSFDGDDSMEYFRNIEESIESINGDVTHIDIRTPVNNSNETGSANDAESIVGNLDSTSDDSDTSDIPWGSVSYSWYTEHFDDDLTSTMSGSHTHILVSSLAVALDSMEQPAVTIDDMMSNEYFNSALSKQQMQKAAHKSDDEKHMIECMGTRGQKNEYSLTVIGEQFLRENGLSEPYSDIQIADLEYQTVVPHDLVYQNGDVEYSTGQRETVERSSREQKSIEQPEDYGTEEQIVDSPIPINKGTQKHTALRALNKYANENDTGWVSVRELFDNGYLGDIGKLNSASAVMSMLFRNHGLCKRQKLSGDDSSSGIELEYKINEAGRTELHRLGGGSE